MKYIKPSMEIFEIDEEEDVITTSTTGSGLDIGGVDTDDQGKW